MSDLLLGLLIFWAVIVFRRRFAHPRHRSPPPPHHRPATVKRRLRTGGDVVACHHCGLFVPKSESVIGTDGQRYCSSEHAPRA
ncbi:MAG: PP0621 family protein [Acidiferrobacter sp.]